MQCSIVGMAFGYAREVAPIGGAGKSYRTREVIE
jgi:hypothetical protein